MSYAQRNFCAWHRFFYMLQTSSQQQSTDRTRFWVSTLVFDLLSSIHVSGCLYTMLRSLSLCTGSKTHRFRLHYPSRWLGISPNYRFPTLHLMKHSTARSDLSHPSWLPVCHHFRTRDAPCITLLCNHYNWQDDFVLDRVLEQPPRRMHTYPEHSPITLTHLHD